MICPVQNCPIRPDVENIVALSGDLAAAFRKLRKDLHKCGYCPATGDCTLRGQLSASIQAAITQVTEEWNLTEVMP